MKTLLLAVLVLVAMATSAAAPKAKSAKGLYAAIAYEQASNAVGWASDRKSSREARVDALQQCGREGCVVVMTVSRECAALATSQEKFSAQKGATQLEAQTKALGRCGAGCQVAAWVCTR